MKREDLKGLELSDEVIEKVMALHGKDIEKQKTAAETAKAQADALQAQLTEANAQIESFKGKNVEQIEAAANEWKQKAEAAQKEADATILKFKQEQALDRDLKETFKVADLVAVKAHLKSDAIKYNDKEDSFVGLKEQIEPLKEKFGSYFSDHVPPPQITTGGQSINTGKTFTVDQIKQMSTKEINANWQAVQETLSKGK